MAYQPSSYRKFLATSISAAMVATAVAPVAMATTHTADAESPFEDGLNDRYKTEVLALHELEIIQGDYDGYFNANHNITRSAAALMLARAKGYVSIDGELLIDVGLDAPSFPDVAEGSRAYNAILALEDQDIVNGRPDGSFGPNDYISRAEMAIILAEGFGFEKTSDDYTFPDRGASSQDAVQALYDHGITDGKEDGSYGSHDDIKRSDFSVFVYRSMGLGEDVEEEVDATVESVSSINHQMVKVTFNQELDSVNTDDFDLNNGIDVLDAEIDSSNGKVVYLTTTAQTAGFEYDVSYKDEKVGVIKLEGNTGVYDSNIQITPADTELKQVSTSKDDISEENIDRGKRAYSVNVTDLTGNVDIALVKASDVWFNSDGKPVFVGDGSLRADFENEFTETSSSIEEINGVPQSAGTTYVNNVNIPADGQITFTVDNEGEKEIVIPVVFQDANSDNHLSVDSNGAATEAVGLGGAIGYYYSTAEFGTTEGVTPLGDAFKDQNAFIDESGVLYRYDEDDNYKVDGVDISQADFETLLTAGDQLDVIYTTNGSSTFNFTTEVGSEAPSEVGASASGSSVTVTWGDGNIDNDSSVFTVERASTVGPDGVADTNDDITEDFQWAKAGESYTNRFTDTEVADGQYVYRVTVENPVTGVVDASSASGTVDVPVAQAAPGAPRIVKSSVIDNGLDREVDSDDVWNILFDKTMSLEAGASIRATEMSNSGEYSDIVLGEGNTFETRDFAGQTLLTITFTEAPAITGYHTYITGDVRNGVVEYPLMLTNSKGFESTAGVGLDEFTGDNTFWLNDTAPEVTVTDASHEVNEFTINFDEPIDIDFAADKKNYKVMYDDEIDGSESFDKVNEITRVQVLDWNTVKVWTLNDLGSDHKLASELTLNVSDIDGNKAERTVSLTEEDLIHPAIAGTDLNVEDDYIEVTFDRTVTFTGENDNLDTAFTFTHDALSTNQQGNNMASVNVDPVEGEPTKVRVYFADDSFVEGNFGTLEFDNSDLAEDGIKGTGEYEGYLLSDSEAVADVDPDNTPNAPTLAFTDSDTVVLTFDEYVTGQADDDDFTIESGTEAYDVAEVVIAEDTVTLTLDAPVVDYDTTTVNLSYTSGNITDEYGNIVADIEDGEIN